MIYYIAGGGLFLIGLYILLVNRNLIKMIIGLGFMETGVNIIIIAFGYVKGKTAPILSTKELINNRQVVDPLPQALVLTAIVIGVAVTALALSMVVSYYKKRGSLNLSKNKELKW